MTIVSPMQRNHVLPICNIGICCNYLSVLRQVCLTNLLCLVKFTLKAEQTTAEASRGKSIEAVSKTKLSPLYFVRIVHFHDWDCIVSPSLFYISNWWKWLGTMPCKVKQWTSMSVKRALYESPVKQSWCRSVCCPGVMDRNSILEPAAFES